MTALEPTKLPTWGKATPGKIKQETSAKKIIDDFLATYGLQGLGDWAWKQYKHYGGGEPAMQQIRVEMYERPEFKARFPAYEQLAKQGKAMSVDAMMAYEQQARAVMHDAGLPPSFYDSPDDFAKFMVNDVSPQELQSRVQLAERAALSAPQATRDELARFGIDAGQLTAYWLDPNRARPILEQTYTAAEIGGRARMTGFGQVEKDTLLNLAQQGVSAEQAQEGFGQLAEQKGLFEQQEQGEAEIDKVTQIGAVFSNDAAAKQRIKRRQEARQAGFSGSSGFGVGQKGVTGLGRSDAS